MLGLIGMLAGIVRPLISLNQNIVMLTMSVDQLKDVLSDVKDRVGRHGEEIDKLHDAIIEHEARIAALEK